MLQELITIYDILRHQIQAKRDKDQKNSSPFHSRAFNVGISSDGCSAKVSSEGYLSKEGCNVKMILNDGAMIDEYGYQNRHAGD